MCGSRMIWHFSTSPYFSNILETSASVRRGWIPVTKRLEPGLMAPSSSSLEADESLGGLDMKKEWVSWSLVYHVCRPGAEKLTHQRYR